MKENKIRIAFSGIGGVGGYYGGRMAAHYEKADTVEIVFIARGKNKEAIRENGLLLKNVSEEIICRPSVIDDDPSRIEPVDFLFSCTKSYDLEENIQQLKPIIHSGTVIIPLQNGVNSAEIIRNILPDQEVWEGCVYIGARMLQPGIVQKFTIKEQMFFGSPTGDQQHQQLLLRLLTASGINAFVPEDINLRIWKKFIMISTAATLTSYYDQSIGNVIRDHYDDFLFLGHEAYRISKAIGVNLPDDIAETSIEAQRMMPEGSTTSMHADFQRGGKNELETLTGYIVRCGEQLGIATPYYTKMYNHLKEKSA